MRLLEIPRTTDDRVIYHLVQGYRKCCFVSGHHIGGRVAYQNNIYSGVIHNPGHGIIVGRVSMDIFSPFPFISTRVLVVIRLYSFLDTDMRLQGFSG